VSNKKSVPAYIIAVVCGLAIWTSISAVSGTSEAWDSPLYFTYGVPASAMVSGVQGYIWPARPWRWPVVIMLSQALLAVAQNPTANLLPLGLIAFGLLAIPGLLTAYLGAFLRNKSRRR
jgi:peptidoglycan/LPS O-acetylase OafA/YrhL